MRLEKIIFENFRNYSKLELELPSDENIFFIQGENAQGKTNFLEAIYLLSLIKSFRVGNSDLVKWGDDYCRIKSTLSSGGDRMELEVFFGLPPQSARSLKINGVKTSSSNFIGNCQIVFFHPEDLNMLYLGPDLRRKYLDIINIQINRDYFSALKIYKKILEQRNSLLKRIKNGQAGNEDLEIWDIQLAEKGAFLTMERSRTIDFFNQHISQKYNDISSTGEEVRLIYRCFEDQMDRPHTLKQEKLQEMLHGLLGRERQRDLAAEFTTKGPHRDEIEFTLNGKAIEKHASRGEYRSILLALKLLEIEYFEQKSGETPILLLDDVFSELDEKRSALLMKCVERSQTFLTTTHNMDRLHAGLKHASSYTITSGAIQMSA